MQVYMDKLGTTLFSDSLRAPELFKRYFFNGVESVSLLTPAYLSLTNIFSAVFGTDSKQQRRDFQAEASKSATYTDFFKQQSKFVFGSNSLNDRAIYLAKGALFAVTTTIVWSLFSGARKHHECQCIKEFGPKEFPYEVFSGIECINYNPISRIISYIHPVWTCKKFYDADDSPFLYCAQPGVPEFSEVININEIVKNNVRQ